LRHATPRCLPCLGLILTALSSHASAFGQSPEPPGANKPESDAAEPSSNPPPLVANLGPRSDPPGTDRGSRDRVDLRWDPDWPEFRDSEFIVTGLAIAASLGSLAIPDGDGRWTTRNGFDEEARDTFLLKAPSAQQQARDASDILLIALTNQLAIDSVVVAWWGYDRPSITWQMSLMDIEVLTINAAVNGVVAGLVGRQRPYGDEQCARRPVERQTAECLGRRRYRSFFSGHASTAFAAAGLTCMHHAHMPLYGGGSAEAVACGGALTAAAAVGSLRVMSDQHWVSDIMIGATIGSTLGFGLPWALHYRGGATPVAKAENDLSISLVPSPTGGTVVGTF